MAVAEKRCSGMEPLVRHARGMTLIDRRAGASTPGSRFPDAPRAGVGDRLRSSLRIDAGGSMRSGDAWVGMVRESLEHYSAGKITAASRLWLTGIVWHLTGDSRFAGDHVGRNGIVQYHRGLHEASDGTFQQSLVALDGTGPLVEAHLRSVAGRGRKRIDMTTLLVFELSAAGIRRVTELPGDQSRWDAFWGRQPARPSR
jgi:hypothetical protein